MFKFRWLKSNRVSPDQLQPEVNNKSEKKSKARRLVSSFTKVIRNLFNNVNKRLKKQKTI